MNKQTSSPNNSFFLAGGTLRYDAASYVMRPADDELYQMVHAGKLCYVLTSRQMGKSSLMNRLGRQLQSEGVATALVDLTTIGTAGLEEWYLSLLDDLQIQLSVETDAETWWNSQTALSPVKRFTKFIRDIVLDEVEGQIVIFIDEVDSALNLAFSDDFFAAIRAVYNQTLGTEDAGRLAFVLLGVATPNELIKNQRRTPFNVGERIELGELDVENAVDVFSQGLPEQEPPIVYQVYEWTAGHPYLMQRICQAIARDERPHWSPEEIDELVAQLFFTERALVEESNLQFVNGRILASPHKEDLLAFYKKIHRQEEIQNDERDPVQSELKLYGLLKPDPDGHLDIRNNIYRQVFDQEWIKQNQPPPWKRYIWAALILVTILSVAISFYFYQQAQNSTKVLAETYMSNFTSAGNTPVRWNSLAQLIALGGYEAEAISLFEELPSSHKLTFLSSVPPDLEPHQVESVIETLYLAQWAGPLSEEDRRLYDTVHVLITMAITLRDLESLDNPSLRTEINYWWQAKLHFLDERYNLAQDTYSDLIALNGDNLGARYERAQVSIALEDDEMVLADLSVLQSHGSEWDRQVRSLLFRNPRLYLLIEGEDNPYNNLAQYLPETIPYLMITMMAPTETPTPTETAVPSVTPTPSPAPPTPTSTVTTPTATPEPVAALIKPPASLPQTTPTGSIIYTCGVGKTELCSINADGSNQQQLTFYSRVTWMPSFTAGLTNILFSSTNASKFTIFEADIDGQNAHPISVPSYADYSPMASPDNELIAFTRAERGDLIYQNIWVMNRDGTGAHPLTSVVGNAINPSWSPDGSQIAYSQKLDGEYNYSLWIMNADGTDQRKLPIPLRGIGERADWSPNGQWLVFYAGGPGDFHIYIVAVDGSVYYRVTDGSWPSFSPDGNWVVFTYDYDGDYDLYLVRVDGEFLTPLTINDTDDRHPRWGR